MDDDDREHKPACEVLHHAIGGDYGTIEDKGRLEVFDLLESYRSSGTPILAARSSNSDQLGPNPEKSNPVFSTMQSSNRF